jgi:hypothetical protein
LDVLEVPANPYGYNTRDVWSTNGVNIVVDGLTVNLIKTGKEESLQRIANDQMGKYNPSENGNRGNVYKNVKINLSSGDHRSVDIQLGEYFTQHSPVLWEDVVIQDNGGGIHIGSSNDSHEYNISYKDIDVIPKRGAGRIEDWTDNGWYSVFGMRVFRPDSRVPEAMRRDFIDVHYGREFNAPFVGIGVGPNLDDGDERHPFDQYFVDSSIKNFEGPRSAIFRSGSDWVTDQSQMRLRTFMDNMTLNVIPDLHQWVGADAILRMRNCQDRNGHVSDEMGTYTSDASDEGGSTLLIPTSLMSNPGEISATVTSGTPSVQSVQAVNGPVDPDLEVTLDQDISTGSTIDVDWTARVTPLDEYRTTGLFVARPVPNKSYTSGDGPFRVDLRGVASTQETKAHEQPKQYITYSATSSDTGVVTASVRGDGYTLELTDQSAGTATITVTGAIDGVGTTTDTFEVTVE